MVSGGGPLPEASAPGPVQGTPTTPVELGLGPDGGGLRAADAARDLIAHANLLNVRHRVLLESNLRLRQQPAIRRSTSIHGDHRRGQYGSIGVRSCSDSDRAGGLPEHVLSLCSTCQPHTGSGSLGYRSGNLEDPDVVRYTREGNVT